MGPPVAREVGPRVARRRAVAEAGHLRDEAVARPALDDPDPSIRATALGALARMGALRADDLRAGGRDLDADVRRRTAELLGAGTAPDDPGTGATALAVATPILAELLDDADPTVIETAAWATGEVLGATDHDPQTDDDPSPAEADGSDQQPDGPAALAERLAVLATDHDDALVREAAVAALGSIGDPAGLPAILVATGDKATVRRRAVIALAPFAGPEVRAALERARGDRDWQVRQAAEDLLAIEDEDDDLDDADQDTDGDAGDLGGR